MKRKWYMFVIIGLVAIIAGALYLLYQGLKKPDDPYKELDTVKLREFFVKPGDYYVYAQRAGCPYCDNVKDEIIEFSKKNQLYILDTRAEENEDIKDYDWAEHHSKYDEEIGRICNGKMVFYNGLTEESLKEKYSPLDYTIKVADKDFVKLNNEKEEGKIYAIRESPIIDYSDASASNLIIAAVPTLFHIKEGQVVDYYFGDVQILDFLGIEKSALDEYIS